MTRTAAHVLGAALVCAAALACACSRAAPDATPEGALKQWLDRMEESLDDPSAAREAYALLGPAARANLETRAQQATEVEGRRAEPYEMLAEGRFGLRFRPKVMKSTVVGDQATVDVVGGDPATEHATVRCTREAAGWRVEPELPPIAPLPQRGDGGS